MQLLYAVAIVIGLVILWRGFQFFQVWQKRLRVKLEAVPPGPAEPQEERFPELGSVRIRPREEPKVFADVGVRDEPDVTAVAPADAVETLEPIIEAAPYMVADESLSPDAEGVESEAPAAIFVEPTDEAASSPVPEREPAENTEADVPVLLSPAQESVAEPAQLQSDMFADEPIWLPQQGGTGASYKKVEALYGQKVEPVQTVAKSTEGRVGKDLQKVISVCVFSKTEDGFRGEELLRSILSYGLRFGDRAIFHRHEQPTGRGQVLFSMVKAVEPGYFDLDAMSNETIQGVIFFLELPGVSSISSYDLMLDTARRLAQELNGEVLDIQQELMTRQLAEHYREQVQDFERQRLSQRPTA